MIFGREGELARMRDLVADARDGRGGALLVTGEAGIGKTALVTEAVIDTEAVWLVGVESERDLPYAALTQLTAPLLDHLDELSNLHLAALEVVLGHREGREPGRLTLSMAVLSLVETASRKEPLVVVVDDVQWLDPPSRDALLFVARRLVAEPVAVLVTLRSGTLGLDVVGGLTRLELNGLAPEDAVHVLPRLNPQVVRNLVERTAGNPLALIETARGLDAEQAAGLRALPHELDHTGPEEVYGALFADLGPAERRAARLTALAGEAPREVLLASLHLLDVDLAGLAPVEELALVEVSERARWRHPLARSAAARGTSADLIDCHAALAESWSRFDPGNPARAWHLAESTTGTDPVVSEILAAAGDLADRRGASADAADAYERAARLHPDLDRRAHLLASSGQAAGRAGQCLRAATLLESAVRLKADPDPDLLITLSSLQEALGRSGDSRTTLERVVDGADDPPRQVRAVAELLTRMWSSIDEVATEFGRSLVARVEALHDPGDPTQVFMQLYCRAILARSENRLDDAHRLANRAHSVLAEHRVLSLDATLLPMALLLDGFGGAYPPLRAHEAEALAAVRRSGDLTTLVPSLMYSTQRRVMGGHWSGAVSGWEEVELLARLAGMPDMFVFAAMGLAEADAQGGRIEAARVRLAEIQAWRQRNPPGFMPVHDAWVEVHIHLTVGDPAAAIGKLRPIMADAPWYMHHYLPIYTALLRETESPSEARAELKRLDYLAHGQHFSLATTLAADNDHAATAAVKDYARAGADPWDLGFLHLHTGRRFRRAGDQARAQEDLTAALQRFRLKGAVPWVERAETELRATGARVSRRTDGETLSPGERRVADLVAAGHTNKEVAAQLFLSPKTVEFHLSSAYRKFAVTNRTALARRIAKLD